MKQPKDKIEYMYFVVNVTFKGNEKPYFTKKEERMMTQALRKKLSSRLNIPYKHKIKISCEGVDCMAELN